MFGNIRTAEDWNRITGTDKGREIYDSLRPFHECPIELRPAKPGLETDLISALKGIGVKARHVSVFSFAELRRSVDAVPDPMKPIIAHHLASAVTRSLADTFGGQIVTNVAAPKMERKSELDTITALFDGICLPVRRHLVARYGEFFEATASIVYPDLRFDLLHCLEALVGNIVGGEAAKASAIRRMLDFFLDGNIPLGSLPYAASDFSYAVLAA